MKTAEYTILCPSSRNPYNQVVAMKKVFFLTAPFIVLFVTAFGQDRNNSVSAYADVNLESSLDPRTNDFSRIHEVFYGLQYGRNLAKRHSLHGNVGYSNLKNTTLEASYLYSLPLFRNAFSFVVGAGLGVQFFDNSSYVNPTIGVLRPQGGFDFWFPKTSFGVFGVYKPTLKLKNLEPRRTATVQFGVGFRF